MAKPSYVHGKTIARFAVPSDRAGTFQTVPTQPLPCPTVLIASTDDPYCTGERATAFANDWKADCHLVDQAGHLNSASNLGDWPLGQDLLDGLLASARK